MPQASASWALRRRFVKVRLERAPKPDQPRQVESGGAIGGQAGGGIGHGEARVFAGEDEIRAQYEGHAGATGAALDGGNDRGLRTGQARYRAVKERGQAQDVRFNFLGAGEFG